MLGAYDGLKVVQSLAPVKCTATSHATGIGVDRSGYGEALMVIHVGIGLTALSGSIYWTFTFEESDTLGSGYTTIADADLEGGTTDKGVVVIDDPTEDEQTITRAYRGSKKYVRMLGTLTGTNTNGTPIGMFVILAQPNHVPVTQATEVHA